MNVLVLKLTIATLTPFAPIPKDHMCVAAWKVLKAMDEAVQVNADGGTGIL